MKQILASCLVAALATAYAYAGPVDDVKAAAKKLGDATNYSWSAKMENANGGGFGAGTATGVTEKGGCTVFTREFNGTTMQSVRKGDAVVLQNMEGAWVTREEMMQQFGGGGRPARGGFFDVQTPAESLVSLAEGAAADLTATDGVYSGSLSTEEAAKLMTFGLMTPKNPSAAVKIWLKDGTVTKYQLHLKGAFVGPDGQERPVDRINTTEITNVGSTKVTVPEGAKAKLGG